MTDVSTSPIDIQEICISFSTPLGWVATRWSAKTPHLLRQLTFGHATSQDAMQELSPPFANPAMVFDHADKEEAERFRRFTARLQAYAQGDRVDFADVPIDLSKATPFQRRVIEQCRQIPWGETRTYGEVAKQVGSSNAARAVGNVMAQNRFPLIVPCHRVVGSAGRLGGYSASQGLAMKRRLLKLEGVQGFE